MEEEVAKAAIRGDKKPKGERSGKNAEEDWEEEGGVERQVILSLMYHMPWILLPLCCPWFVILVDPTLRCPRMM